MHRMRDRTACGSLIAEHPGWVICACRGPSGPSLIIVSAQEGDDEEEAAAERMCVFLCVELMSLSVQVQTSRPEFMCVRCFQHLHIFLATI